MGFLIFDGRKLFRKNLGKSWKQILENLYSIRRSIVKQPTGMASTTAVSNLTIAKSPTTSCAVPVTRRPPSSLWTMVPDPITSLLLSLSSQRLRSLFLTSPSILKSGTGGAMATTPTLTKGPAATPWALISPYSSDTSFMSRCMFEFSVGFSTLVGFGFFFNKTLSPRRRNQETDLDDGS